MKQYEVLKDWGRYKKGDKTDKMHETTAKGAILAGFIKEPSTKKSEK